MIFKQLPTIINDLNTLGISLKALDSMNIGIVGLNTGNIQAYQSAIKGLSAEQAVFALVTKGANAAQIEEIMTTETATLAKGTYTQADIQAALAKNGLASSATILTTTQQKEIVQSGLITSEKLAEIATTLGLTTAEDGSLISKKALNVEMVKQQLESMGVVGAAQKQILVMLGLTTAEGGAITGTNVLTASFAKLWAMISAHPIGAIITAIGALAVGISSAVSASNKAKEEARQTAIELTNTYTQEKDSLDSQIEKYKELKETLDSGNLSTDEARSIKEQLLEIQESLIESYGNEASNIDLVNGKYKEQLGLLSELSKEKADDYVKENRAAFEDAKRELEKVHRYEIGSIFNYDSRNGMSAEQKQLYDYIKSYSELFEIVSMYDTSTLNNSDKAPTLFVNANADEAKAIIDQFYDDIETYIKDNNLQLDYDSLQIDLSKVSSDIGTDDALKEYREIYDEFMKAEIVRNDTLRPLYQQSIQAVEDYNNALSTGEGVEEAKANLDSVQQSVQNATGELEGSQDVFDGIYDGIYKDAEAAYNLGQAFENDKTVQEYAEQLRGLSDIDLKAINFDNDNTEKGEEAFRGLMETLGLTEQQVQSLIDKLVELGYVQGEVQGSTPDNPDTLSTTDILSQVASLSEGLDQLDKIYADIYDKGDFDWSSILNNKEFEQTFGKLGQVYEDFIETVSNSPNDISACQAAFDNLATAYVYSSDILKNVTSETRNATIAMLEQMGIANAQEIVDSKLANTEQLLANAKANLSEICKTLSNSVNSEQEAKYLAKLQSIDLENATYEEIQSLIDEANILGISCNSLIKYKLEKMNANNATINTSDDINNLLSLASAAGIASSAVSKLAGLKARYDDAVKRNLNGDVGAGYEAVAIANQMENAAKEVQNEVLNFKPVVNYGGVSETRKVIDDAAKAAKDAADKVKEAVAETFDFIENGINLFEKNLSKIEDRANNTGKSFKSRAKAYEEALRGVSFGMELLSDDYNKYMAKANSIGLDESIAQKVRGGDSNIWDYTDDNLKQQIKDYQTWYNKAQDCLDKIEELKQKQVELSQQSIELIITQYEKYSTKVENANSRMEKWISLKESWGFSGNTDNYNSMNKNIQKQIGYVIQQDELLKKLQKTVTKGSEAWYEYNERIDANKSTLYELKEQMVENAKAAAELAKATADKKVDKYSQKDELYDAKIDNATSAKSKNNLINKKISNINNTQKAYDDAVSTDTTNLKKAKKTLNKFKTTKENKSVLSEIKKKIKAGKRIPQSLLKKASKLNDNGKLYKACVDYNAYFDAKETDKQIADLYKETSKQEKANLAQEKFDNIASEYDYGISGNEQKKTSINNKISLAETQGKRVSTAYYDGLISAESAEQQKLIQKRDALQKSLNEAVINGYIEEGSEEWYAMVDAINEVTNSIDESTKSLVEFHNQQRQIKWDAFDDALETVGRINSESDYYIDLMSNKDMVDKDSGKFTEYGAATLGLHQTNYESYLAQAEAYQNEYNSLMDKIARGEESITDENVIKRLRELQDGHRNAKLAAEDELQACQNLIKQGYETQLDILSKLIDKYKKLKDSELESYKYQKEIAEKTKNIAALQKQLSVYGNNDTEESRAQIQKLKLELQNAQDDLKDTEYEKFISDTETMLDDLFNDYEAFIDDKINNTDTLLTDIKGLLGDEGSIVATLKALDPNLTQTLENTVNGNTNAQDYTNNEVANEQNNAEQPVDNSGYDAEAEAKKQAEEAQKEKERQENERKRNMLLSQIKIVQDDITEMEKELQRLAEEEEEYKNAKKDKKNKGKVFVKRDWASLRKTINGRLATREQELEDLNSQLASIPQYEKGSSHISKKQLAWTQENGSEMIYRASDGAMLTPLGTGDKVFTNEMSERFWKLAQMNPVPLNIPNNIPTPLPVLERNTDTVGDVNIDLGGITMYGVNDPETFGRQLREEICKNGRTTQCVAEAVSAKQLGKSGVGNARMYK